MNKNNELVITEQQKILCKKYHVLPLQLEEIVAIALDTLHANFLSMRHT